VSYLATYLLPGADVAEPEQVAYAKKNAAPALPPGDTEHDAALAARLQDVDFRRHPQEPEDAVAWAAPRAPTSVRTLQGEIKSNTRQVLGVRERQAAAERARLEEEARRAAVAAQDKRGCFECSKQFKPGTRMCDGEQECYCPFHFCLKCRKGWAERQKGSKGKTRVAAGSTQSRSHTPTATESLMLRQAGTPIPTHQPEASSSRPPTAEPSREPRQTPTDGPRWYAGRYGRLYGGRNSYSHAPSGFL
ncbi:hypothetical protein CYMTET_7719, partial [Cymbomonas tetramitiformis]